MFKVIISFLISLFVALLFINIYYRIKVFKLYRKLVMNRVEFGAGHIFSRSRMKEEILPKYPQMEREIKEFVNQIYFSIVVAFAIILLITMLSLVLIFGT
jgi:ABC-type transporter Mla maintaining outer membrane lipid asymmetry permease subunit MlaE